MTDRRSYSPKFDTKRHKPLIRIEPGFRLLLHKIHLRIGDHRCCKPRRGKHAGLTVADDADPSNRSDGVYAP